jgi:ATP/maltotriose-dependent transcriptional regulator MalT/DNA-binding SARP family transcriptional activator
LDPIIRHAIAAPLFGAGKLDRAALVRRVLDQFGKKLIVLAAPAGYGKTTLLANVAKRAEIPLCWVRMREENSDLGSLAELLRASMNARFRALRGRPRLERSIVASPRGIARVFSDAITGGIEDEFAIVLDDCQFLNLSLESTAFLDELLRTTPPNVTFIVAGREAPDISLAQLLAEEELAGLGPQDLALTREEVIAFLRTRSRPNQDAAFLADRLMLTTGGWITGVLLSEELAGGVVPEGFRGDRPAIFEYLASVVFNRLDEGLRRFMMESSVLPVMTSESCNAVLRRTDSNVFLATLVRKGLFVTATNDTPRTYEYSPQVRQFLVESLMAVDPSGSRILRTRLARYYSARGLAEEAIDLMTDVGDMRGAARLAEQAAGAAFEAGRIRTLEKWSRRLAGFHLHAPSVLIELARGHLDQGKVDLASSDLRELEGAISVLAPRKTVARLRIVNAWVALRKGNWQEALGSAIAAEGSLARTKASRGLRAQALRVKGTAMADGMRDYGAAIGFAEAAIEELEVANDKYSLVNALIDLNYYQLESGLQLDALRSIARALDLAREIDSPVPLAIASLNAAVTYHYRSNFERALDLFEEARRNAALAGSPQIEGQVTVSLGDLFSDLGLMSQAGELYEKAMQLASSVGDTGLLATVCLQSGVLHRRAGSLETAIQWIERACAYGGEGIANSPWIRANRIMALPIRSRESLYEMERLALDGVGALANYHLPVVLMFRAMLALEEGSLGPSKAMASEAMKSALERGAEQFLVAEVLASKDIRPVVEEMAGSRAEFMRISQVMEIASAMRRAYSPGDDTTKDRPSLKVTSLGKREALFRGSRLGQLKPLHEEVLFFLIDRKAAEKDLILELFWRDAPMSRRNANLHMAIYSLRRALGKGALVSDGTTYRLATDLQVEYDTDSFERAAGVALRLARGDPRRYFALTDAKSAYKGQFLTGWDSEWVIERRRSLEGKYLNVLLELALELEARGNRALEAEVLGEALTHDPLRDDLNSMYLGTLGFLGRRSEMVVHYSQYRRLLSSELGLDPPSEIRELYDRLIG